ncbi:phosphatase PAP2 family protein [Oscillatoria sp. FACHB-1406]|uniref:phosphatase PAP2 family protein n=1 Tax=Oscillatoria sp. FACHB-1406 TaxID=2692846 RepID=UPI00168A1074|nr:phosphatase PAP2 family protein [Oscillatoria sp. FACHB-1406]MBD2579521.1 phosphatase PAP2 family protein [Oscillatoria sp. FACHB-1406]
MLRNLIKFWVKNINPRLADLISTLGILGLLGCSLSIALVAWLCEDVLKQESFAFDRSILLAIHQFDSPTLDAIMLAITNLGNPAIVIAIALSFGISLWVQQRRQEFKFFAIACLGAAVLNTGLKLLFMKQRPELWHRLITETSFSFPSGHALGSLVLYGFIASLLAERLPRFSRLIHVAAIVLIALIGFSRLYLGVHWPTDLLAGYSMGFVWLQVCLTMLKLQRLREQRLSLKV